MPQCTFCQDTFLCEKGISLEAFNLGAVQYVSSYSRIPSSYCCPQERAENYLIIEITVPWIPAYTKSMSWVLLVASVPWPIWHNTVYFLTSQHCSQDSKFFDDLSFLAACGCTVWSLRELQWVFLPLVCWNPLLCSPMWFLLQQGSVSLYFCDIL